MNYTKDLKNLPSKSILGKIIKIITGIFIIATVIIGYMPQPQYLVELTCISNTLAGLLLIADGIFDLSKKKVYFGLFHLNVTVGIMLVFLICMGSILTDAYKFNFNGAFFFMHVINPIAVMLYGVFLIGEKANALKCILTAPIMVLVYLLFDCVRFVFTGEFVYGFVKPEEFTFDFAIIAGIAVYVILCLFSLIIFALNRLVLGIRQIIPMFRRVD